MSFLVTTIQLLFLVPVLSLLLLSRRTSRAQRSRHGQFVAVASLIGLLVVMGLLVSLGLVLGETEPEPADLLMHFLPPLVTLVAIGIVLRRGLSLPSRTPPRRAR